MRRFSHILFILSLYVYSVFLHFTQSYHIKIIMISNIIIDIITIVLRLGGREKAVFNECKMTTTMMFLYKHIPRHYCLPQSSASSHQTKENEHNDDTGTVRHNFHLVIISIYLIFHLHSAT